MERNLPSGMPRSGGTYPLPGFDGRFSGNFPEQPILKRKTGLISWCSVSVVFDDQSFLSKTE